MSLNADKQINQKQLSEITDKDQTTLTRILDVLQRKELIQRQMDEQDRRAFIILLTSSGNALKQEVVKTTEQAYEKILFNIPRKDLELFTDVLTKMNNNIQNEMTSAK